MKIFISSAASKLLSHKNIFVFQCDCRVTNEAANTALQCFRSDITVVCKAMEFGQFPLDKHKCYFILTSCKLLLTCGLGWAGEYKLYQLCTIVLQKVPSEGS